MSREGEGGRMNDTAEKERLAERMAAGCKRIAFNVMVLSGLDVAATIYYTRAFPGLIPIGCVIMAGCLYMQVISETKRRNIRAVGRSAGIFSIVFLLAAMMQIGFSLLAGSLILGILNMVIPVTAVYMLRQLAKQAKALGTLYEAAGE